MKRLVRVFGQSVRRKFIVAALGLVALALTMAYPGEQSTAGARICYGIIRVERYYSDATYSVPVGRCEENDCEGTYICAGQMTDFVRSTTRGVICNNCLPQ